MLFCYVTEGNLLAKATNTLPSPSFGPMKPPPLQADMLQTSSKAKFFEISDHPDSTSPNSLKRSSSDSDDLPDLSPNSRKRAKNTITPKSNKENLSPVDIRPVSNDGYFSLVPQPSRIATSSSSGVSKESPSNAGWMETHSDLLGVSVVLLTKTSQ